MGAYHKGTGGVTKRCVKPVDVGPTLKQNWDTGCDNGSCQMAGNEVVVAYTC